MHEVFIVAAVRTPTGSFGGSLQSLSAAALGAKVVGFALNKAKVAQVDHVYFGNALQANNGQNVARQVAILAGLTSIRL
jgi:acetyl-CoA C-acetyltransferase